MFKAKTKEGTIINVETIEQHNQSGRKFYCPYCNSRLIIRAGNKYRKHFSHTNSKNCSYERESIGHYEGKLMLLNWLQSLVPTVEVEYYIKSIKRIADLYFIKQKREYVLELQCSRIMPSVIKKRTQDYNKLGFKVIWIIGKNQSEINLNKTRKLTDFEIECMRNDYILYFDNGYIYKYCIIMSTGANTFYGIWSKQHLKNLTIDVLLNHTDFHKSNTEVWLNVKRKWRIKDCLYYIKYQPKYAKFVYNNGFAPSLFPTEIGIPIKNQHLIKMNPFVWQSYIYIYIYKVKQIDLYALKRYCRDKFILRSTIEYRSLSELIVKYLNYLIKRNCIQILNNVIYRKDMKQSYTIEEAIKTDETWSSIKESHKNT